MKVELESGLPLLGYTYTGPIRIGTGEGTTLDVTYDTGSDWLSIDGKSKAEFDWTTSGTEIEMKQSVERMYGQVNMTGSVWSDRVCLTTGSVCLDSFNYFLIEKEDGLNGQLVTAEPVDGILGLTRGMKNMGYPGKIHPLIVEEM
jgi:hypothetical protein